MEAFSDLRGIAQGRLTGRRMLALAGRAAVAAVAASFTLAMLSANNNADFAGFDAPTSATIAAALLIAACGALAVLSRRNSLLRSDIARLADHVEDLAGHEREPAQADKDVRSLADAEEARAAAEAASRAKSRFLAMVSHEVRTPLNGILGMADLLADTSLTAEQQTYLGAVKASGETLLSLIDDILDFSKIEADKLDLAAAPFALAPLVEGVVELLGPRAQAKGLEIASSVDERLPEQVIGDAARLRQVLLNLAGNAVKFTDAGGLAIMVRPGDTPGTIAFQVRDTGIGIAPDAQARIFGEFEQADSGAARSFGGTGLGLAISQRIVARMGGRIAVESRRGDGATFHFTVVLARGPATAAAGIAAPDSKGQAVLLVSPSVFEAPLLAERLGRWGAAVRLVADGAAARVAIAERPWDTIMVDAAVGTDAAAALARTPAPIPRRIVILRPGDRHDLAALKDAGFSGYLVKPVRSVSLAGLFESRFDRATAPAPAGGTVPHRAAAARLSVLVAEDNQINALLTQALLAKLGHRPTMVETGAAAVEAWRAAGTAQAPYDLVLMDLHMPGMDGMEAARRIRAEEAEGRRTPIVALTANASPEDRDACLDAGMDGVLTKPLDAERLAAALGAATGPGASSHAA